MFGYLARRIGLGVVTVLVASALSFLLVLASGGSPGAITAGEGATKAQIAAENVRLGWDRPLVAQYGTWLGHAVRSNFGVSLIDGHGIWPDLMQRIPVTASIAVFATLFSAILGILIGVVAAVRRGRLDRLITVTSGIMLSLPQFWLGILLVYVLSVKARLLPATGYVGFMASPTQYFQSLVLPVLALGLTGAAIIVRTTRAGMVNALQQEHIRTLRALGTPVWRIRYLHALRFAGAPVVSVLGIQFIALFGGSVVIEQLFALPGLGQAASNAIDNSDIPAVQGVVVIATVVVVITNLVLDVALAALDPKVRTA